MILGLALLKKWNPSVNWANKWDMRRKTAKQQDLGKAPGASHKPTVRKVKAEPAKMLAESEASQPLIPKKYSNLAEVFSERDSDVLPPHHPMDCAIEIMLGAKMPKLKMYSIFSLGV